MRDALIHQSAMSDYRAGRMEALTLAEEQEIRAAPTPLAFWRVKRGMTQAALAKAAGTHAAARRRPRIRQARRFARNRWRACAKALSDLPVDKLVAARLSAGEDAAQSADRTQIRDLTPHKADAAIAALAKRGVTSLPPLGLVLGSGLGGLADEAEDAHRHSLHRHSRLSRPERRRPQRAAGRRRRWRGGASRCFRGAAIITSAATPRAMCVAIETFKRLGGRTLFLTNAAGGLHTQWRPPALVAITDHINFAGANPLIGLPTDDRFVPLTDAYDRACWRRLKTAARNAPTSICTRASTCGSPARASRRRPKSARRRFSAPIWSACRRFPR